MKSQNKDQDYSPSEEKEGSLTSQITIQVCKPQQKSQLGGANKFYIYPLKGKDKLGNIQIIRRYSDFDLLRTILLLRWPGTFITSLPQKKFIGNNEQLFLQQRKDGINGFLQLLSEVDFLWYSEEVQLFLKNNTGETDKIISKLKEVRNQQLLKRYQEKFPQLFKNQINAQITNKILSMSQFLKQSITMIQNLQKMSEQIYISRKKYSEKYLNFVEFLLPDYEQNCVKVYQQLKNSNPQNEIFKGSHAEYLKQHINELKQEGFSNPVFKVLQQIRKQRFEILAFEQTLKIKDHYLSLKQKTISKVKELQLQANKIQAGNSSIMAKITNKTKDQQMRTNQSQLKTAREQQKQLSLICDIITAHLAYSQIDLFKKNREKAYYKLLKSLAQAQKISGQTKRKLWIEIGRHQHINLKMQQTSQQKKQTKKNKKAKKTVERQNENNQNQKQPRQVNEVQHLDHEQLKTQQHQEEHYEQHHQHARQGHHQLVQEDDQDVESHENGKLYQQKKDQTHQEIKKQDE